MHGRFTLVPFKPSPDQRNKNCFIIYIFSMSVCLSVCLHSRNVKNQVKYLLTSHMTSWKVFGPSKIKMRQFRRKKVRKNLKTVKNGEFRSKS